MRLDLYLSQKNNLSRKESQSLITSGCVFVNGKQVTKNNFQVSDNHEISIGESSHLKITQDERDKTQKELTPWNYDIDVVYEDEHLLVVNKASGIIVHPTSFGEDKTLANAVKHYFNKKKIENEFNDFRNGIVHRLDKDTSGLIVVAKNKKTESSLKEMFINNSIHRYYLALINGHLDSKKLEVQAPIKRIKNTNKREVSSDYDAEDATTIFYKLEDFKNISLVRCELKTGKTHQIRVHAKYIKHSVVNDPVYGSSKKATSYGQYLVANEINFVHPITKKLIDIKIDMPKEFNEYIRKYGK